MTNKEIARALKSTASLLVLSGANPFRARAYENAARRIERMEASVAEIAGEGALTGIEGIGKGLAAQIEALVASGSFDLLDELRETIPPGVIDLLDLKGLGVKTARRLWTELDVTSLDELEAAAEAGRLSSLDGLGPRTEAQLLEQVRLQRSYRRRRRYASAWREAEPVLTALRGCQGVDRAEVAGALRRRLETVDAAEFVAVVSDAEAATAALAAWNASPESGDGGSVTAWAGTLPDGLPLRVVRAEKASFGTDWWRATGSAAHVETLGGTHGEPDACAEEASLFESFGLSPIPPELREGDGELGAAATGTLPALIEVGDLRGSLHNHTTYSDGANTLEEMAEAARARGLSYFGVCDHSRSLRIASGLSIEEVRLQQAEIRALNERYARDAPAFRVFSGTECDILADGSLDYPDDVLKTFDFVVASVHTGLEMTEEEATERVLAAVANPHVSILGHATGRLLLAREGYPLDHERVIDACARHDVAIELNANPYRLDMDWRWLRAATTRGVLVAINPDAHRIDELDYVRWGVAVARKGWLTAAQCLNALALDGFEGWLGRQQAKRPA